MPLVTDSVTVDIYYKDAVYGDDKRSIFALSKYPLSGPSLPWLVVQIGVI